MTRLLFLLYLLLSSLISKAQENLILNPSCEEATEIPNNIAAYENCINWWKPYIWTTDYYTDLTIQGNQNFIPSNVFGYQTSISGNYYLGIVAIDWNYLNSNYIHFRHDYVAGRFTKTLLKDKIYQFEFWISKANNGIFKTNAIDLILTYDTIVDVNNFEPYGYKIWSEDVPMTDTVNWVKISTCFKAKGTEKAFAIGNFHELSEIVQQVTYDSTTSGEIDYRYLDNFSLIECPTCCPDQFAEEEQVYILSNPGTQYEPAKIELWLHPNTSAELEIFDAAGRLIEKRSYSMIKNTFTFEQYACGLYQYVVSTSDGLIETGKVLVAEK